MSSTLVYQEFSHSQSQSSSSLSLKLNNPSKLTFSSPSHHHSSNNNDSKCVWSAIESLSSCQKQEREIEYVHPSAKRSSMSEKSLEMCTESLGSETGAFFTESYLCFSTTATTTAAATTSTTTATAATTTSIGSNSNNNKNNNNKKPRCQDYTFPPPLTTMRGSNSLQVRPHREDGRLVIEVVVSPPSTRSYLKAERSDGRLRMSLVREREEDEDEDENEEESQAAMEEGNLGNNNNNNIDDEEEEEGGERVEEVKGVEGRELGGGVKLIEEDKNGIIKVEFGGKMGKLDHQIDLSQRGNCTSCRCKEGGRGNMKRLINWEPFWVAT